MDLRNNDGGSAIPASYLYSHLIHETLPYYSNQSDDWIPPIEPAKNNFNGKLAVLINGGCFSQTGLLCSLLKYYQIGTLVGEETGGSFICGGWIARKKIGTVPLILNNSKIKLIYPTVRLEAAVSGFPLGKGIIPDYVVTPSMEDYLNGTDRQMEYAVQLIK